MLNHLIRSLSFLLLLASALGACGDSKSHPHTQDGGTDSAVVEDGGRDGGGDAGGDAAVPVEPSLTFVNLPLPIDLTSDGRVALLQDLNPEGDVYFYDTTTGTLTKKTTVGDTQLDFATGISDTLRVTALHGDPVQAGFFAEGDGWTDLPNAFDEGCDHNEGTAWDISADGKKVVGAFWNGCSTQAFLHDESGSEPTTELLELLGHPTDGSLLTPVNRATVISDDGKVIAGFAQLGNIDRSPAVWDASTGEGVLLYPNETDSPGEILAISPDGSVLAGTWGSDGFIWTEADGKQLLSRIPDSDPADSVFPNAIARDGQLIFGTTRGFFSSPVPFVWTQADGMRSLADIIAPYTLTMPVDAVLTGILAASTDGTVIIGTADVGIAQQTFVLHLPVSAYGIE